MSAAQRLTELGIALPEPLQPKGSYVPLRRHGDLAFLSGCTGRSHEHGPLVGTVGTDLSVEQATAEARVAALNMLAAIDHYVGLDQVQSVLHLRGYIRAAADFGDHPAVLDGASLLLGEVFGPAVGVHARTALGVASLPGGACVELDAVIGLAA